MALVLGVVGLYGVIAYSVSQRTREIGVRIALGAARGSVYRLVLREAGAPAAIGIVVGLVCAVAAATFMRKLLFDTPPGTWHAGGGRRVLLAAALLASYVRPAGPRRSIRSTRCGRRSASLDPSRFRPSASSVSSPHRRGEDAAASISRVISIIVGRKPASRKRRWAAAFFEAVCSSTRGMPRTRIQLEARGHQPRRHAAAAHRFVDDQIVDETGLVAQILPGHRLDGRIQVADDDAGVLGGKDDGVGVLELSRRESGRSHRRGRRPRA